MQIPNHQCDELCTKICLNSWHCVD